VGVIRHNEHRKGSRWRYSEFNTHIGAFNKTVVRVLKKRGKRLKRSVHTGFKKPREGGRLKERAPWQAT